MSAGGFVVVFRHCLRRVAEYPVPRLTREHLSTFIGSVTVAYWILKFHAQYPLLLRILGFHFIIEIAGKLIYLVSNRNTNYEVTKVKFCSKNCITE